MPDRSIAIHPAAPLKPAWGADCNGCGVCCLVEPCPVGCLASRRLHGACVLLRWDEAGRRYRCGLLTAGTDTTLPQPSRAQRLLGATARRWIAAGKGCDCNVELTD